MDAKRLAADALMRALEDWAKSLGEAGVTRSDGARYFPSRQMDRTMRRAHSEGRLLEVLTDWLPTYRGLRTNSDGNAYANRMRDIVEHGSELGRTRSTRSRYAVSSGDRVPPITEMVGNEVMRTYVMTNVRRSAASDPT